MIAFTRALWRCRRATAGLEFALVLPVMLAVYAGVIELNAYMNVYLRVNQTAFELEDLIGRQTKLSDAGGSGATSMATICSFAAPIFQAGTGADLTKLKITVSSATVASGVATVQWEVITTNATKTATSCMRKTTCSSSSQSSCDAVSWPSAILSKDLTPGTESVGHLAVNVTYPYSTILPTTLLNSLHVGTSKTSIGAPLAALAGHSISVTAFGVPRYFVGSIPYN